MTKYKHAIWWIANNDSNGESDRLNIEAVSNYVSTILVADVFRKEPIQVGKEVIKERTKQNKNK